MVKVELKGGAYEARSIIANAQRCVNLFPERNPEDAASQFTHYLTPGLRPLAQGPTAMVRGLHFSSNNKLYAVIGSNIYFVGSDWSLTLLGAMVTNTGRPVAMQDNSTTLVIVDGTATGYTIDLASNAFAQITSAAFYGSNTIAYLDSFMLFNRPGTKQFYSTLSNNVVFDPLYFAQKTAAPDLLVGLIVKHREIWLFGQKTTEVWYNAGNSSFPFASMPGTFIEHGCCAVDSIAKDGSTLYWLTRNDRGQAVCMRADNYEPQKVSTFALEAEWARYSRVDDAQAYVYQQAGHVFYVLTFPTANKTWVYDGVEELWHERAWMAGDGSLHRHRSNCHAFAYGTHVVGDWQNGKLYAMDDQVYTDDGQPIQRLRSFPHLGDDGRRVIYNQFIADMEVGFASGVPASTPPMVALRWSDTRGASWGQPVLQSIGATGQFLTTVQWRRLGLARGRVFELSWSFPHRTALNGAFIDPMVCAT